MDHKRIEVIRWLKVIKMFSAEYLALNIFNDSQKHLLSIKRSGRAWTTLV